MDRLRGVHRRFLNRRQGLNGIIGNLFPNGGNSSPTTGGQQGQQTTPSGPSSSDTNPLDPGGALSSLLGDITTAASSSSGHSSSTTPKTNPSSSSTGSTASSAHTSASTSTSTNSVTTSATATLTAASTAVPSSDVVYTSSDGTSIIYVTSTPPAASASATATPGFFQNAPLEGGVFAVVGFIALVLLISLITWTVRKRQRDRLEKDMAVAVTFDPGVADRYEQETSMEKHRLSGSSSGHDHGYGYGFGVRPAYAAPQPEYHAPVGYGQYSTAPYPIPPPKPAAYQVPSPAIPQPAAQGGANLTRKYSDRKPVPPLLLTPGYDPSNSHVSIPPQFYQQ